MKVWFKVWQLGFEDDAIDGDGDENVCPACVMTKTVYPYLKGVDKDTVIGFRYYPNSEIHYRYVEISDNGWMCSVATQDQIDCYRLRVKDFIETESKLNARGGDA